jgi:hypothetical protein
MYLENVQETPDQRIRDIVKMAIDQAKAEFSPAQYEGQFPRNGFGIQELRPTHVGMPVSDVDAWLCSVTSTSTYTYISWFDITVNQDCYLIVTGVMNLTPNAKVVSIKFTANGEELPVMHLEEIYAYESSRVYLTAPFIVKPKSGFKAEVYGTAATQERLGLLGYCLGKRAYIIGKASTSG